MKSPVSNNKVVDDITAVRPAQLSSFSPMTVDNFVDIKSVIGTSKWKIKTVVPDSRIDITTSNYNLITVNWCEIVRDMTKLRRTLIRRVVRWNIGTKNSVSTLPYDCYVVFTVTKNLIYMLDKLMLDKT